MEDRGSERGQESMFEKEQWPWNALYLEFFMSRHLEMQCCGQEKLGFRTLIKDIAQGSIYTEVWRSQAKIRLCKRDHKK